jgi:hypothetical protein
VKTLYVRAPSSLQSPLTHLFNLLGKQKLVFIFFSDWLVDVRVASLGLSILSSTVSSTL